MLSSPRPSHGTVSPGARSARGPGAAVPKLAAAALLGGSLALLLPGLAAAQEMAPRIEDASLPEGGGARFRIQPVFQAWDREFGPGPDDGRKVPLRADFDGPLLDRVYPGREPLVADLNGAAPALGFDPLAPGDASLGALDVREVAADVRGVLAKLELGILDRLSVDAAVPVLRTEVEPFASFDPSGANLGPAATVVDDAFGFLGDVADAREALQQRVDADQLAPEEEDRARELLQAAGAFASVLGDRVTSNALLPLAGTPAGDQMMATLEGLRGGFADFGLALPELGLASEIGAGTLAGFIDFPLDVAVRGWLAGEPEFGLRFLVLDGFAREPEARGGVELRTTVGARLRVPLLGDANSSAFIRPFDALGVPLGDGQRDLELSFYQDVRVAGKILVHATARYGIQRADRLLLRSRSPERPFTTALARTMEREPGDYVQVRVAPRLRLNPILSVGAEYRFWHEGPDSYRLVGPEPGDASVLELETEQTRHRLGFGAYYRPDPPEEGEERRAVPEMGFAWQTAVAGSGGETPAAGLTTVYVRIPFRVF